MIIWLQNSQKFILKTIDTIQEKGIRIEVWFFNAALIESLYMELNEQPLKPMREKLIIQYYLKLKSFHSKQTWL